MRISDLSSDVCSSDLVIPRKFGLTTESLNAWVASSRLRNTPSLPAGPRRRGTGRKSFPRSCVARCSKLPPCHLSSQMKQPVQTLRVSLCSWMKLQLWKRDRLRPKKNWLHQNLQRRRKTIFGFQPTRLPQPKRSWKKSGVLHRREVSTVFGRGRDRKNVV